MAAAVGVSPRTMKRWLNEGSEFGVKAIPAWAAPGVEVLFQAHRDVTRDQARADGIPWNQWRPIFLERKMLRNGQPGDRVVGEHAQYIRRELRMRIMADQQRSQRYLAASVRSVIDLSRYFRLDAEGNVKQRFDFGGTPAQIASRNLKAFQAKEKRERGRIIDKTQPFPLFTRYENISPQRDIDDMRGVVGIEKQLRAKHEPATGLPGTVAADQILLQLLPAQEMTHAKRKNAKQSASKKRAKRRA